MILRSVLISGMAFGLLVQGPSPVGADSGGNESVRIVVTGRLLGHTATMRVHDSAGVSTIRVTGSRSIRVHSGRVTIVPSPIVAPPRRPRASSRSASRAGTSSESTTARTRRPVEGR